ncbi:hypothetical protein C9374_004187 [Naegleria lovaniensis]|uniref:Peptidase family M49 n=1 Tax=Naegleria lovaniensis TaxID=51637 RepID=A0AA88GQK8_NAELO|nr:uncharacterized protein C9374_004187 [Naegleria lovaniensis]KAG2383516.1 hypothetical protein C9374_004187 [Naegleria lovaniensis]
MAQRLEDDFELQDSSRERDKSLDSVDEATTTNTYEKTIGEKFLSKFKWLNHVGALVILIIILLILGGLCAFAGVLFSQELGCGEVSEYLNKYETVALEQTSNFNQITSEYDKVITQLKKAADIMGEIYREQMYSENAHLRAEILPTACHGKPLALFDLNFGPWIRINDDKNFIEAPYEFLAEVPKEEIPERKLPGAGYYPHNVSKIEMHEWIRTLSATEKKDALSYYTVIKKQNEKLVSVPYSDQYKAKLTKASNYLMEASKLLTAKDAALKTFLVSRAQAFLSNKYEDSDLAWMNVTDANSMLEVTIGPYETYDDELLGLKTAFEAYIGYRDTEYTQLVSAILDNLQKLEDNLPMRNAYPHRDVGALNSIRVINQIYVGGQANGAIKSVAYNLPTNDDIVQQYGSKRVVLKNVQKAKFNSILSPIAKRVVAPSQTSYVVFKAFFTQVLSHEIMHGLGPHKVVSTGQPLHEAFGAHYAPLEELKADIGGLWLLSTLLNNNTISLDFGLNATDSTAPANVLAKRALYTSYLASVFRSVRYGVEASPQAKANAAAFNFLRTRGAIVTEKVEDHTYYTVDTAVFEHSVHDLLDEILEIMIDGDTDDAETFWNAYGKISSEMTAVLKIFDELAETDSKIPVDLIFNQKSATIAAEESTPTTRSKFEYGPRSFIRSFNF